MKEKFLVNDWEEKIPVKEQTQNVQTSNNKNRLQVEKVIHQLELGNVDITSSYTEWRNTGFALVDEFGEDGRDYFHRISKLYPNYSYKVCNAQYDKCLNSKGSGITIATLFHKVKEAGIKFDDYSKTVEIDESNMSFSDSLYTHLPEFLQQVVKHSTSDSERDILLLGSIVTLSSCLPNYYCIYDGEVTYPNLYLFVTAQASAGKGRLKYCQNLVEPIHDDLREQTKQNKAKYEYNLKEYKSKKKDGEFEILAKPVEKMLFIPANSSATGFYQILSENDGKGLMFETEGDTLANTFSKEYGNYSEGFRKIFHHERMSYFRRKDNEYVDINNSQLSVVLSGTPNQVKYLIPDTENGLFSRFIFYFMHIEHKWRDVFAKKDINLNNHFDNLGKDFHSLYKLMLANSEVKFTLTAEQEDKFTESFNKIYNKYFTEFGVNFEASIFRTGIITYRIAMILSALRIMKTGVLREQVICQDEDFYSALYISAKLLKHSSLIFSSLPHKKKNIQANMFKQVDSFKDKKQRFLEGLPKTFNRQDYLKVADSLSINHKTADNYVSKFAGDGLIHKDGFNEYIKVGISEVK